MARFPNSAANIMLIPLSASLSAINRFLSVLFVLFFSGNDKSHFGQRRVFDG